MINKKFLLAGRPVGRPISDDDFEYKEEEVREINNGEVLLENMVKQALQKHVLMFIILMKVNSIMFLLENLPIGVIYLMILTFFFMKDYMVRLNLKISISPNILI